MATTTTTTDADLADTVATYANALRAGARDAYNLGARTRRDWTAYVARVDTADALARDAQRDRVRRRRARNGHDT